MKQFALVHTLALAGILLAGCRAPDPAPAAQPLSQPAQQTRHFTPADVRQLKVSSRHSEVARIGDLAGLLVMIQNDSEIPVPKIRIQVTNAYFDGLDIRRTQPQAVGTNRSADGRTFEFDGPPVGARQDYLLTLTPLREGDYPGELSVSVIDGGQELLVAIYDLATKVEKDRFAP